MMGIAHAVPSARSCVRGRSAHGQALRASVQATAVSPVKHLIVEANGVFGYPGNWDVINRYLDEHLDMDHYLIHASKVNQKTDTFHGIDTCGKRLAEEIQQVSAAHPELQYISMIGHSMGGLILRYAAGYLYNKDEKQIAGLTPVHFITMATPHLGCDSSEGENQVPLVKWLGVSKVFTAALDRLSVPVTTMMFGLSGQQLFMSEPEARAPRKGTTHPGPGRPPLLLRLAFDVPGEGHFFSALRAFHSRTCYGNAEKDHLVGWANSTLRFTDELPVIDLRNRAAIPSASGVVLEDPPHSSAAQRSASAPRSGAGGALSFACVGDELPRPRQQGGAARASPAVGAPAAAADGDAAPESTPPAEQDMHVSQAVHHEFQAGASRPGGLEELIQGPRAAQSAVVLERLRSLGWARVDCAWRDARLGAFAHNHIQVTRGWLNFEGKSVCKHLAQRFLQLEDGVAGTVRAYTLPHTASRRVAPGLLSSGSLQRAEADQPPLP